MEFSEAVKQTGSLAEFSPDGKYLVCTAISGFEVDLDATVTVDKPLRHFSCISPRVGHFISINICCQASSVEHRLVVRTVESMNVLQVYQNIDAIQSIQACHVPLCLY